MWTLNVYVRILLSFHPTRHVFLLLFPSAGVPSSLLSTPLLDLWPTDEEGRRGESHVISDEEGKKASLSASEGVSRTLKEGATMGPRGKRREMSLGFTEKPSFFITKCYVLFSLTFLCMADAAAADFLWCCSEFLFRQARNSRCILRWPASSHSWVASRPCKFKISFTCNGLARKFEFNYFNFEFRCIQ